MPLGEREVCFGEGSAEEVTSGGPAKMLDFVVVNSEEFDRSK